MIVLLLLSDAYTLAVVMQCAVWNRDVLAVVLNSVFHASVHPPHTHTHRDNSLFSSYHHKSSSPCHFLRLN